MNALMKLIKRILLRIWHAAVLMLVLSNTSVLAAEPTPDPRPGNKKEEVVLPEMTVTATPDDQRYQDPSSTAGTRFPAPFTRVPQSIQVIPRELIEDRGLIDLPDLLENVPAASIGQSRVGVNGLFGNSVSIRGFPVSITRNGFRHLYFEDVDPSAFSNVERVEIIKGPGSAVIGQEGLGGTLNYVTKRPLKEHFAMFRGSVGEDELRIGTWDVTGPLLKDGALSGRFTGEVERSETFVDFQDLDRDNLAGSLSWDDGGPLRAFLNAEYQERNSRFHPGLPIVGTIISNGIGEVSRETFLGESRFNSLDYDGWIVQTWLEYDISPNWKIAPRVQYFQWNGLQTHERLRDPVPGSPHIITRSGRFDFQEHDDEYTAQLELSGLIDTGPLNTKPFSGANTPSMTISAFGASSLTSHPSTA
ncbi:MAG: TonB-dependent siderophore receptor [Gammaproteobacteria bacterium]